MLNSLQQAKEKLFSVPESAKSSSATAPKPDASNKSSSPAAAAATTTATKKKKTIEELAATQKSAARSVKAARVRNIQTAMNKERAVREALEPFDFWTNVKRVNWTALIIFMVGWSALGYYVVPAMKGWKDVWTPPTQQETDVAYQKGKQKFIEDTYRLTQRHEARKQRAERLDRLAANRMEQIHADRVRDEEEANP